MRTVNYGITAERVRAMCDSTGKGMAECKEDLQRSNVSKIIMGAEDVEDLRPALLWILENYR